MPKKGGLGSGISALFGEDAQTEEAEQLQISIEKIEPRDDQPRQTFDKDTLAELTNSIRTYGMIQPITVRPLDNGYYQIIAGERRWRAAREANLEEVPIRIIHVDDKTAMELALVENLQREDLNPIEEAKGYQTLMREYGLTQEEAAQAVGKSRPAIANALRLLNLSEAVMALVENGELSPGHARALIPITNEETQQETAETIVNRGLTVRQTEALVKQILKHHNIQEKAEELEKIAIDYVKEIEQELENALGRKVKLSEGKKKGKIELEYYGAEDREKLIENLKLFSSLRHNNL